LYFLFLFDFSPSYLDLQALQVIFMVIKGNHPLKKRE